MQIPCKIYFGGNKRNNKDLLKKELKKQSLITIPGWTLYLNWTEKKGIKDKEYASNPITRLTQFAMHLKHGSLG